MKANSSQLPCSTCKATLTRQPHRIKKYKNHFCNKTCKGLFSKKKITSSKICNFCIPPKHKPLKEFYKNVASTDGRLYKCILCYKRDKNKQKANDAVKRYYRKNITIRREAAKNKARQLRKQDPDKYSELILKRNLKKLYKLSLEDYNNLIKQQNGLCKICRRTNTSGRRLSVDHNHSTGKVRGLLCGPCNVAIGMLQEDSRRLTTVIEYLKQSEHC